MLGLASVIKRAIISVFPEMKELDKLRNLMHQEVIVREEAMFDQITIMWSTLQKGVDLKKTRKNGTFNHFVPLVSKRVVTG